MRQSIVFLQILFVGLLLSLPGLAQEAESDPSLEESLEERLFEEPLIDPLSQVEELEAPDEATDPAPELQWLRGEGFDTVICPFRNRIDYDRGQVECGLIRVPENREVEGSRTIELHFVRIPARGEDKDGKPVEVRDDPVIYLTGGPGVKVEMYVDRLKNHPLMAARDLYILEHRGIGYSGDFCPFFSDRNRADHVHDNFADSQRAVFDMALDCARTASSAGVDLSGYHTFENARDVRALRLALGLDDWNVWGISYGSVLGQAYMKVDPEGIRALVLDAIVPLDLDDLMRIPYWHTLNLEKLFAACVDQRRCSRVFGDLAERYRSAIGAITERPVRVDVPASEIHPTGEAWFFQDVIAGLPFSLLYDESTHAAIPAIIDGLTRVAEKRDTRFFRALALADGGGYPVSMGMAMTVRCLDGYVDRWAEAAPDDFRDYPLLARAFGDLGVIREAPTLCRQAGLMPRDPAQFELVQTDLPIVVANGAWDPITPVPLAEKIMPGFSNGQLVVFPHAGHGPTRSLDCAGDFMNGFFDDPAAPLDMDCVETGQEAAEYIAPYFRTSVAQRAIVRNADDEDGLRRHALAAGSTLALILLGGFSLLFGWVSRRVNGYRVPAAGGARFVVFLATLAIVIWLGGLGGAAWATSQVTETMLIFGLVSWAMWFAWAAPVALLLGLGGLVQVWRYKSRLGIGSLLGLSLVSLAASLLSLYGLYWDLWPI